MLCGSRAPSSERTDFILVITTTPALARPTLPDTLEDSIASQHELRATTHIRCRAAATGRKHSQHNSPPFPSHPRTQTNRLSRFGLFGSKCVSLFRCGSCSRFDQSGLSLCLCLFLSLKYLPSTTLHSGLPVRRLHRSKQDHPVVDERRTAWHISQRSY